VQRQQQHAVPQRFLAAKQTAVMMMVQQGLAVMMMVQQGLAVAAAAAVPILLETMTATDAVVALPLQTLLVL
jgi:hypothetical protein